MDLVRDTVRRFAEKEVLPHLEEWETRGEVPRDLHRKAAALGLMDTGLLTGMTVSEELIRAGASSGLCAALFTHGIAIPHIRNAGDPAQIARWVTPTLAGEKIGALRSEEHTSELQSPYDLVCRLLLEKKKMTTSTGA